MGFNFATNLNIEEVTINQHGDKIYISADDAKMFDEFIKCFDFIIERSSASEKEISEIEKKYEGKEETKDSIKMAVEMSQVNVAFSNEAATSIDGIFGENTVKKYFRDHYEKIPSFLPSVDCFLDFFEQITPVMEQLFDRKMKDREKASKARMAKYKPVERKQKGRSGAIKNLPSINRTE